jgi:hypothetical protein
MQEVGQVIGSVKLQTDHPELFHYTGPDVLKHIVYGNTIWATHFRDLSDSKEITVLKEPMYHELVKLFDEAVAARGRNIKRRFRHYGGAPPQARRFVDSIYKATFEIDDPNRAVDAFTTSFSTHSADSEYERENGLESQWECYGKDGFCIVFDTVQMCRILKVESDKHDWTHLNLDPVRYAVEGVSLRDHFPELIAAARSSINQFLNSVRNPEMAIVQFLEGATLMKLPTSSRSARSGSSPFLAPRATRSRGRSRSRTTFGIRCRRSARVRTGPAADTLTSSRVAT